MPANLRSLRLTNSYRHRLFALREQVQGAAPGIWDSPDRLATVVEQAQKASLRLTAGYLAAFVASETGKPTRALTIDTKAYSGSTADGQPLAEGMRSPLIGFFAARKNGASVEEATKVGIDRAKRQVGMNYDAAHRTALMETIASSDLFDGWSRAVRGTCGACAAKAGGHTDGLLFQAHPGCFPAGVSVGGPAPVAASKRWYEGDLVELRFEGGGFLACTPNHPILTTRGWVAAHKLSEGGNVIRSLREQGGMASVSPDNDERPAFIEEVAEALRRSGKVTTRSVPTTPEDFHGDGTSGNVNVVAAHGFLQGGRKPSLLEKLSEVTLCPRHAALVAFAGTRHLAALLFGMSPASALMGGFGQGAVLLGGSLRGVSPVDITPPTNVDSHIDKGAANRDAGYAVPSRQSLLRFAGEVETSELIGVRRYPFAGHVFNLQSSVEQWYIANRTVVHNCQCVAEPSVAGVTSTIARPTGTEIFHAKTREEQDAMVGPEAAEKLRAGEITLTDLAGESHLDSPATDFLTQAPLS